MIYLELRLRAGTGLIRQVRASGHALRSGLTSLPCGVVTSLVRAFGRWAIEQPGLQVDGLAGQPGSLELNINMQDGANSAVLHGASQLLLQALRDSVADFPTAITLNIMED